MLGYDAQDVSIMLEQVQTAAAIIKENKACNLGLQLTANFLEGLLVEGRI